jgi:hypothetical protein
LKADDLPEEGQTLTIDYVEVEELGQGTKKEAKPVIYFKEETKGFVCNLTNFKSIEKVTGEQDTDEWTDHKITLYPTPVEFQGDTVLSIRVKQNLLKKKAAAATSKSTKDEEDAVNDF